jgi:hypothetical protein
MCYLEGGVSPLQTPLATAAAAFPAPARFPFVQIWFLFDAILGAHMGSPPCILLNFLIHKRFVIGCRVTGPGAEFGSRVLCFV